MLSFLIACLAKAGDKGVPTQTIRHLGRQTISAARFLQRAFWAPLQLMHVRSSDERAKTVMFGPLLLSFMTRL